MVGIQEKSRAEEDLYDKQARTTLALRRNNDDAILLTNTFVDLPPNCWESTRRSCNKKAHKTSVIFHSFTITSRESIDVYTTDFCRSWNADDKKS